MTSLSFRLPRPVSCSEDLWISGGTDLAFVDNKQQRITEQSLYCIVNRQLCRCLVLLVCLNPVLNTHDPACLQPSL